MKVIRAAAVVAGVLLLGHASPEIASAECCGAILTCFGDSAGPGGSLPFPVQYCGDCSAKTPFNCCGNGGCNIFCCNCDRGCKSGLPSCSTQAGASNLCVGGGSARAKELTKAPAPGGLELTRARFQHYDVNGDGRISEEEFLSRLPPGFRDHAVLKREMTDKFRQSDADKSGSVEPGEFDRDLAAKTKD